MSLPSPLPCWFWLCAGNGSLFYIVAMRKIVHIDMDCFYAAIEMRDNPSLRGRPLAVGGPANSRGVLCTCNYEARRFGIRSAMASSFALRQCPELILLPVAMEKYKTESQAISEILHRYTDRIEPLSLDEAFLDLSGGERCGGSATLVATEIRDAIRRERGLTASAGIAPNKFLAKIASDWKKPDGQFTVSPEKAAEFAADLDLGKLPGVGKVGLAHFHALGLRRCADLLPFSPEELVRHFGRYGTMLYGFIRGEDERPVETDWVRKSLSVEETFPRDIVGAEAALHELELLFPEFLRRLGKLDADPVVPGGRNKLFVKIKYGDFRQTTIERGFADLRLEHFRLLFLERYAGSDKPIRLLGMGLRMPDPESMLQTYLELRDA